MNMPTPITKEMIEATYTAAKSVYAEMIKENDAINKVVSDTGMNHSSAKTYITMVVNILRNKSYTWTIKGEATDYFLTKIREDFDLSTYKKALGMVWENVKHNKNPQNNIKAILYKHEDWLKQHEEITYPDELQPNKLATYPEGTQKQRTVNAYERNPQARAKCIEHHGLDCKACGFNFAKVYGEIGEGYIHVHHIKPLSEIKEGYQVDPINDLIPVCPNCHAMLHRKETLYSIEELRKILNRNNES